MKDIYMKDIYPREEIKNFTVTIGNKMWQDMPENRTKKMNELIERTGKRGHK